MIAAGEPTMEPIAATLAGGGEMGALMRALDWSRTPLGPVEGWPRALKTCVRIMLTSRQPMWLGWGDELTFLYNDPYRSIVGGKHPRALGQPTAVVWREIWAEIAPRIQAALGGEEGTYDEALLLIMERNGYPEETYYTFSYSPIPDDDGCVAGIFCANTDDTRRVIGDRQLALLRDLAAEAAEARTVEDACALSMRCLESNPQDVPFAVLYLLDPDQRRATLCGATGIAPGHPAAPEVIALDDLATWPLAEVVRTNAPCLIPDLGSSFAYLPAGAWDRPPAQAVALPVAPPSQSGAAGMLIVGLHPYRLFDDDYRSFLGLVAGQIAAAIAAARAYEEERRRAEALAELDRAKMAFFNNISHEFRTPLTLMLGPLEDVLAAPGDADLVREQVAAAHRNSLRLLRLVNSLLDFSRVEGGRMEAVYEPTDLAALTAELAAVFRAAIERAGLRLLVDCPPLPEPVFVDREMWEKIVLNLLSNALKFTLEGEIAVTLRAEGGQVVLAVRDTGTGIPAVELPHLFERFHRVRGARARTHEGTGIGLALAHDLVRLHGGSIGVESAQGAGTTFTVTLLLGTAHLPVERIQAARSQVSTALGAAPYVEEALRWLPAQAEAPEPQVIADVSASAVALPATGGAPRARVLLADDNADLRDYVTRLLAARYEVQAVADGARALTAALAAPPDLVLSDVMMPELDGYALVRALRADPRTSAVPVVLLSARAGEESTVEGLQTGADDYLVKPFSARELLARVGTHLELAGVRREARDALAAERDRLQAAVAARARADAALRQQAALLALAHDAIIVRAPDGRILTWNDGAAALYGWMAVEAVGQVTHALLRTRVRGSGDPGTEIDAALAEQGAWEGELEHTRRDGMRVAVESRQALLRAVDGTPEAILEINRDMAVRLELEAALARLQALQSVSDAAFAQLERPALLRVSLERIAAALRADNAAILLLDEGERVLTVHAAQGPEEVQIGQVHVPVGQGVAGRIAATREPLIVADLRSLAPVNPLLREEMASLMGVPLLVEGRLIGVMHVDSATPRQFTADDLRVLQLVADRVALALENARLYHNALEARDQVLRLQRVTAALSAAMTSEQVAEVIIAHGLSALGAAKGSVAMLSGDGASFTIVRSAGYAPEVVERWSTFPAGDAVPISDAVRARELVILASRDERDTRYPHLAGVRASEDDGAMVAVPVLLGERAIGGLGLSFPEVRRFSTEERATMRALGELCAQALERTRLYEAERVARAEAEVGRQHLRELLQQVQAERDRLQQVLDTLPVGVSIIDAQGTIVTTNQAGRELLGRETLGQALPGTDEDIAEGYGLRHMDGTPYPSDELPLVRALRDGEVSQGEPLLVRHAATGRDIPLLANCAPLRGPEGAVTGAVGVFQDITALRDLERAREEFLSSAAHDLKNPLTGIRGQAQLAQRRLARLTAPDAMPVLAQFARIQESTDTMLGLINELVDVARQQMGVALDLRREPTDLVALVRECIEAQREGSGRTIDLETEEAELRAEVDAGRIGRVVGNLLDNAIKYSPVETPIRVRVAREEGPGGAQALIAVRDEGIGIPAADLPHIFDRFRRAGNVAGRIQGTGIGLASARGIVEQHGGTIAAASVEGAGSTFTVRLTLVDTTAGPHVDG